MNDVNAEGTRLEESSESCPDSPSGTVRQLSPPKNRSSPPKNRRGSTTIEPPRVLYNPKRSARTNPSKINPSNINASNIADGLTLVKPNLDF